MDDNNKDKDSSLHLDDIDEFFLRNFNILFDDKKNNEKDNVEVLDFEESNAKKTDIDKEKNSNQETLNFDLDKKDNIEVLDDIKYEQEVPIEILDFDISSEVKSDNKKIDDNVPNIFLEEKHTGNNVEILDDFLLDNQKEDTFFDNVAPSENLTYNIKDNDEKNYFNNPDLENYGNVTYYKENTKNIKIKKIKKIVLVVLLIITLICLFFIITKIVKWKIDNDDIHKQLQNIQDSVIKEEVENSENTIIVNPEVPDNEVQEIPNEYVNTPIMSVDIETLKQQNNDTIGWLKVNGTNIDYPVVQSTNNDYYLTHAFNKNYNEAGWVFADYRNNLVDDKNLIIYGHARLNLTMFGTLKNVIKPFWYTDSNNYLINFSMQKYNTVWRVFSTYTINNENYYITTNFDSSEEYLKILNTLKTRSVYDYGTSININDRILTLSTCYTNDRRVVLHAKLIKMEKR